MTHRASLRAAWSLAALLCLPMPIALAETADELYARGLKLYLSGDYGKATAEVRQALQEDPGHAQAKQLLQVLQESKEQHTNEGGVLSQLSAALEAQQQEGRRLKVVLANAEQRITAFTASQQQDQAALANTRKQLIAAQQETDQIRAQLAADLAALQERLTATDAKLTDLSKKSEVLEGDRAALSNQLGQTQDELVAAKNEIGQLKVARNELDQLQRTHEKALQELEQVKKERAQLKEQAASLGRQLEDQAKLHAQIKDAEARIAQRDEQFKKLRDINSTLEKQYGNLEVIAKDQEANIQALEQKRAALAEELVKTREAAAASDERARNEFGALQQQAQDTERLLAAELEQAKAREQQYVKEVEALRSAQVALEERLTDTRQKGVSVEAELTDARKLKLQLEDAVKAREGQLVGTHQQLQELQRALTTKAQELHALDKTSVSDKETIQNLQEQLRIAKETQSRLTSQVKDFQAVKADRDKLVAMVEERDQAIGKLQGDVAGTARDLETAKRQIQLAEQSGQEKAEQLRIDQKGKEWRVDSLDREARDLRASEAKLKVELESTQKKEEEQRTFRERLVKKLQEREAQLKQAESVIKLLQGGQANPAAVAVPEVTVEPFTHEQEAAASAAEPAEPAQDHPVKIFQVNDELQFVVFSMEGMEGATTGSRLLLLAQDRPIAAVQVTEVDDAGFAVAQIVQMIEPPRPIRKGDLLFARPLPPS